MIEVTCPMDGEIISRNHQGLFCPQCGNGFPEVDVLGKLTPDLRCLERSSQVTLTFTVPYTPLESVQVKQFGKATTAAGSYHSREKLRRLYKTKLQKEIIFYVERLLNEVGQEARILDLGCGSGGNKRYLNDIGFKSVLSVDFMAPGAEYLVDVHRLPFAAGTFDMILTTATLEHFYNPYIAFSEMSRVLKPGGMLIASGSFWEGWHGNSCFHFTPGGMDILCNSAGLEIADLWSGWGFIPSVATHALGLGRFKNVTYQLQTLFDSAITLIAGKEAAKKHKFRTSGSFGIMARKHCGQAL
ncbi:class I SAM-dependent methyltransferase [Geomonas subterranea]|uniref:Class I SAM-dependent methyltransferase n=1 Tax=Geomonas subterranea TaxID=2847989 RepID=A0ABX8LMT9_9BACT|nr:class I SAM-dependent methyltransferase [Geomonas subterranea]QXE91553.1 class I SAM-dependent methyltransferase [Geomonas subterranea]QXM10358.1 class I SAM-dependent methyltransferase [Geomonas subterranea]